jgi:hypothetical protein
MSRSTAYGQGQGVALIASGKLSKITSNVIHSDDNKVAAQDQGIAIGQAASDNTIHDYKDSINSHSILSGGDVSVSNHTQLDDNTAGLLETIFSGHTEFLENESERLEAQSEQFFNFAAGVPTTEGGNGLGFALSKSTLLIGGVSLISIFWILNK